MRYNNTIRWIVPNAVGADALELRIDWDAGEAVVHLEVPSTAEAGPATAHGGFLAALADHVMGFVAAQQDGKPAVTRQMTVNYRAPTPTSTAITVRARADSVTERAVAVSLEGSLDHSGLVTFRAEGDYARISPSHRHPERDKIDYDTLEERFDPSQVFSWLVAALKEAYAPGAISPPALLAVEVVDAKPRRWMFKITDRSLAIEPGESAECDVRFVGTVRAWRELVYQRKTINQLVSAGSATVEDPAGLLPSFLRSFAI
ncbi:MAG TPA: PaaI family thioesterase [Streptosporangiaceae bacterium]|nr:PaaI family thioesterase [Streptosporangiaceae bacterium]